MSIIVLFLVVRIFSLLLIQISSSTFFFGIFILLICLLVTLRLRLMKMVWYSFLFFLIYVGGVLVLFFYILSLNSKPNLGEMLSSTKIIYFSLVVFFFFFYNFSSVNYFNLFTYVSYGLEDKSYLLFRSCKVYFMFIIGLYLVYILFIVSVIRRYLKGALRPIGSNI